MAREIMEQVALRVKEHLYYKERKESDFVKGKRSELNIFSAAAKSHENALQILESKYETMKAEQEKEYKGQTFDKEAYEEIKKQIRQRKEAKERMLQQGHPEFKPYIQV